MYMIIPNHGSLHRQAAGWGTALLLLGVATGSLSGRAVHDAKNTPPHHNAPIETRFVALHHRAFNTAAKLAPDPQVALDPTYKMIIGGGALSVGIYWCIPQDASGNTDYYSTFQLTLDDVDVTSQFSDDSPSFGPPSNCMGPNDWWAHWSGSINIALGSHTFVATGRTPDNYAGYASATYETPVPQRSVFVAAANAELDARPGQSYAPSFTVTNTGEATETFNLSKTCSGTSACSGPSPSQLTLDAGESASATISFAAPTAVGSSGLVTLHATNSKDASVNASAWSEFTVNSAPAPGVAIAGGGDVLERDLCLTSSISADVAYECGDLRVVHPLPAVRTMSKSRAPVLLFESQHANPYPIVSADVTFPSTDAVPTTVQATLTINGSSWTQSWNGSDWTPGETRRIAVGFDGSSYATGLYNYTLSVYRITGGISTLFQSVSGQLPIVNRIQSPFGAGWWLAGLERLYIPGDGTLFWVGGDGSTRLYRPAATGVWTAVNVTRPDSVTWDGTYYYRKLPNNLRVRFDATGLHVATINRLGQTTSFSYTSIAGRTVLNTITLPGGSTQLSYSLQYNGSGQLTGVTSPGPNNTTRATVVTVNTGIGRIDAIQDPDLTTAHFTYDATQTRRMTARTDRRNFADNFTYDAGGRLMHDSRTLADQSVIAHDYRAYETLGLVGTVKGNAQPLDSAYAQIDGPRTDVQDVTRFWFTRFGALRRIRNAVGSDTKITYGDSNWPALATEVRDPTRFVTRAVYNSRGLVTSTTAVNPQNSGTDATTNYAWDPKWNFATSITSPMGVTTTFAYDSVTGNRLWQQTGPTANRVTFGYYTSSAAAGMIAAITAPLTAPDSIFYDPRLGNESVEKAPSGATVTTYTDSIGRDTLVVTPIDASHTGWTRKSYDVMNQVTKIVSFGPTMPVTSELATFTAPADSFVVSNTYDAEGNLTNSGRSRGVSFQGYGDLTVSSTYDGAGRKTYEASGASKSDTYAYDPAGNIIQHQSGDGTVYTTYDAANRPTRRVVPERDYAATPCSSFFTSGSCFYSFPTFGGNSVCISADTAYFVYDAAGRALQADNVYAKVHRTFEPNGLVASETQSLRSYYSNGTSACEVDPQGNPPTPLYNHSYTLSYSYDLDGRRTKLTHPAGTQNYSYDPSSPSTGLLTGVTDISGRSYSIAYDAAARVHVLQYPGSVNETLTYSTDGRLGSRDVSGILSDVYAYDQRDRMTSVQTAGLTMGTWYNGLGAVVAAENYGATGWVEQFKTDALGNRLRTQQQGMKPSWDPDYYGIRFSTYDQDGKLTRYADTTLANNQYSYEEDFQYDGAANQSLKYSQETDYYNTSGTIYDAGMSYYGADGALRIYDRHIGIGSISDDTRPGQRAVFEQYRYDALGRRVLTRSRRESVCTNNVSTYGLECAAYIERVVWDGDQILIENRADGSEGLSAAALDQETSSGDAYGQVVYTNGLGLDQPLEVIKGGTALTPITNWRGQYTVGVLPDGTNTGSCGCLNLDWPGNTTMLDGARPPGYSPVSIWFGNLITDKKDGSGQHYMRNRYYDAETGRFTQEDPIGLAGGMNLYGYAGGDPVNYSDPFGLFACKDSQGKEIACPEPQGGPPVKLPAGKNGKPNEWIPVPGSGKRQKYAPRWPVPSEKGGQPGASWDPAGHWDVKDGEGGTKRYAPDGSEVDHDNNPLQPPAANGDQMRSAAGAAAGLGLSYWIISESLRILFPPRNLIPVP